jgi:hypothetical protein
MVSSPIGGRPQPERDDTTSREPFEEAPSRTMAKRVRGSTSRPGQRAPLQRSTTRPAPKPSAPATEVVARPPDSLTEAEEERAAELEAEIVAEERQAERQQTEEVRRRRTARDLEPAGVNRAQSSLAVSAADEYGYVARDVRRIAIVGGGLVVILIALWLLSHLLGFTI